MDVGRLVGQRTHRRLVVHAQDGLVGNERGNQRRWRGAGVGELGICGRQAEQRRSGGEADNHCSSQLFEEHPRTYRVHLGLGHDSSFW